MIDKSGWWRPYQLSYGRWILGRPTLVGPADELWLEFDPHAHYTSQGAAQAEARRRNNAQKGTQDE